MRQFAQCRFKGVRVEFGEVTLAEERLGSADGSIRCRLTVHQARHLECQSALRFAAERFVLDELGKPLDFITREKGEHLESKDHVSIVGVQPELIKSVWAREVRVEPHGVALALAEFGAVTVGDEWGADRVHGATLGATNQVGSAREVAPLVAATGLQHTAVAAEQLEVVQSLQNLVAELGVTDAGVGIQARADGIKILAELKEQAQAEAARITANAQATIEAERQNALNSLKAEVGTLALSLASGVIGASLEDDKRSAAIVDQFLADLDADTAVKAGK